MSPALTGQPLLARTLVDSRVFDRSDATDASTAAVYLGAQLLLLTGLTGVLLGLLVVLRGGLRWFGLSRRAGIAVLAVGLVMIVVGTSTTPTTPAEDYSTPTTPALGSHQPR